MPAEQLFDLYWLGYLLTGDRERSAQTIIETLEMPDVANQFFKDWMVTWSRKIFIAKVLGDVDSKTFPSQLRAGLRRLQSSPPRRFNGWIDPAAGKPELERALLTIESLPRCALLLRVFEKLSIEDVGILLNVDAKSVKTATAIGMIELVQNLARNERSSFTRPIGDASFGDIEEMTA